MRDDLVLEVRRRLVDPVALCEQLALTEGATRQATGLLIRCPVHGERNPSCSVTRGPDGTIRVRCFSCDFAGDALHLVAAAREIDVRGAFREVLAEAAELAGLVEQATELRHGREPTAPRERAPLPPVEPERDYPLGAEVAALWKSTIPVTDDPEASAMLASRGIDPERVGAASLARVLHPQTHPTRMPGWARYKGSWAVSRSWLQTGHRLLLRAYDCSGQVRSVRAWRVCDGETPKRLPPSGFRASGLVVANAPGTRWLAGWRAPRIVIVEGEPDLLARSIVSPLDAVIGVGSGSWHDGFARRVPYGAEVDVLTHLDQAGERYAAQIILSIGKRANVRRWTTEVPTA